METNTAIPQNTAIKTITKIAEIDPRVDLSFKVEPHNHIVFRTSHHTKTFLEKAFGIKLARVYRSSKTQHGVEKDKMDWSHESMFLFFEDGRVVKMDNSEWASVRVITDKNAAMRGIM